MTNERKTTGPTLEEFENWLSVLASERQGPTLEHPFIWAQGGFTFKNDGVDLWAQCEIEGDTTAGITWTKIDREKFMNKIIHFIE